MLIPEDFGRGEKAYALKPDEMTSGTRWYYGYSRANDDRIVVYKIPAYSLSTKTKTRGALVFGYIEVIFDSDCAQELDGLDSYKNLSVDQVLDLADNVKRPQVPHKKEIKMHTEAIFGNGRMWTLEGRTDDMNRQLVDAWFNLPEVPEGMDAWFRLYKN